MRSSFGEDPVAIYKPTGAKSVSPAKAMANFNGWTFAAVNAIASEVANIQLRLYKVTGDDHEEQDDHPLMTLLDGVKQRMTGIEFKYVLMAHLEFTGNLFVCEMDQPRALYLLDPGCVRVKLDKVSAPYGVRSRRAKERLKQAAAHAFDRGLAPGIIAC